MFSEQQCNDISEESWNLWTIHHFFGHEESTGHNLTLGSQARLEAKDLTIVSKLPILLS